MSDNGVTILAIDDEPNNLRALKLDLEDVGYKVITGKDGLDGWEVLQQNRADIKAILLDRMMPNMDGMAFIKQAKSDHHVMNIPIIMQTAAAEKRQVMEGIQAGVYYYMTKPYDKNIMLSIVGAAIRDYGGYSQLRKELKMFKSKLRLVRDSHFEIKTLEDAHYLATFVSQFFPDPERVVLGIHELLVNSIEHGNLSISYDEKTVLTNKGILREEIERRLTIPENSSKKILVSYIRHEKDISLQITDEGKGFNWKNYLDISPERATHNHGRGIALSRMMSFDHMEYLGCGNEVLCKVNIPEEV